MSASVHQSSCLLHSFKGRAYMPPDFNQVLYGMNGRIRRDQSIPASGVERAAQIHAEDDLEDCKSPQQARPAMFMPAVEEAHRIADEIEARMLKGEDIRGLVRTACFLATEIIAPQLYSGRLPLSEDRLAAARHGTDDSLARLKLLARKYPQDGDLQSKAEELLKKHRELRSAGADL